MTTPIFLTWVDSADTISNFDCAGPDSISFGAGIELADINLAAKSGTHLILGIDSNGDQITLNGWFNGSNYQLDLFAFADGSVKSGGEFLTGLPAYENGTTANDCLYSYSAGNDPLSGGDGKDTLIRVTGNDTFAFV